MEDGNVKAGDDKDDDDDDNDDDDDDDAKGQDSVVWGEQKVYKKNLSFWQRTEVFLDDDDSYTLQIQIQIHKYKERQTQI